VRPCSPLPLCLPHCCLGRGRAGREGSCDWAAIAERQGKALAADAGITTPPSAAGRASASILLRRLPLTACSGVFLPDPARTVFWTCRTNGGGEGVHYGRRGKRRDWENCCPLGDGICLTLLPAASALITCADAGCAAYSPARPGALTEWRPARTGRLGTNSTEDLHLQPAFTCCYGLAPLFYRPDRKELVTSHYLQFLLTYLGCSPAAGDAWALRRLGFVAVEQGWAVPFSTDSGCHTFCGCCWTTSVRDCALPWLARGGGAAYSRQPFLPVLRCASSFALELSGGRLSISATARGVLLPSSVMDSNMTRCCCANALGSTWRLFCLWRGRQLLHVCFPPPRRCAASAYRLPALFCAVAV